MARRGEIDGLRPIDQIAKRLWALNALFLYIADMGQETPKQTILAAARSRLSEHLTSSEIAMFRSWRWLARRHLSSIGWRLENMLSGVDSRFSDSAER
jgi:hypothetical protein